MFDLKFELHVTMVVNLTQKNAIMSHSFQKKHLLDKITRYIFLLYTWLDYW